MKNYLKALSMCALTVFICSCGGGSTTKSTDDSDSTKVQTEETVSNWEYTEETDQMTDEKMYFATCTSINEEEFEFPYNGGSRLSIIVRNMNNQNEVLLYLDRGSINMSVSGMQNVQIRFDNEKAVKYPYNSSADGTLNYAFLYNSTDILQKLKAAKTLKVEVPIFNQSRVIFNFNVEGLKWEH